MQLHKQDDQITTARNEAATAAFEACSTTVTLNMVRSTFDEEEVCV